MVFLTLAFLYLFVLNITAYVAFARDKAAAVAMPRAVGCGECNGTGYSGRVAVLEALEIKDNQKNMLMAGMPLGDIEKNAVEAGALTPFRRYASLLMARNLISPSEALLVVA